jgi:hypothetical protein
MQEFASQYNFMTTGLIFPSKATISNTYNRCNKSGSLPIHHPLMFNKFGISIMKIFSAEFRAYLNVSAHSPRPLFVWMQRVEIGPGETKGAIFL